MAQQAISRAWYEAFAASLARVREARPDLPAMGNGNLESVLSIAIHMHAVADRLSEHAIRSRWRVMRERYPELVPAWLYEPPAPGAPGEPPQPREQTLAEAVDLARARSEASRARAQLKGALTRIAELEDDLGRYRELAALDPQPAQWTLASRPGPKSEHMPYLLTSDFQIGEVIRESETEAGHGYDVATFRRRYRDLIETTIHICQDHSGGWHFPGIIYARGGDTISGGIHDELRETDELTPIEAVVVAVEEEAAGIRMLAEAFGRVEVKDGAGGNHDRDTAKPQSKRFPAHSYDSLVGHMLRREFKDDPRVTFQGTDSPDVRFPIYGRQILLTHGDRIGSRGGQGFIGPAATILRGAQKVIMEQQALGYDVDEVHMGHFHTFLDAGWALCNGCLPGYSEFAKQHRMRPERPLQVLMFYHPGHGRVLTRRIFLEGPKAPDESWPAAADAGEPPPDFTWPPRRAA